MAASSDQPVSVGNLAAALEGGAFGGVEVLYKGDARYVNIDGGVDGYDVLIVAVKTRSTTSGNCYELMPVFPGEVGSLDETNVAVSLNGNKLGALSSQTIRLVLGIRTGGGQLLADLLRDLCKEVA